MSGLENSDGKALLKEEDFFEIIMLSAVLFD